MKKMILASALVFLGLNTAHAANNSQTFFEQLRDMWAQSTTLPVAKDFSGWFSGRCYRADNPSVPFGAVVVAGNRSIEIGNPNNGPLFPPETKVIHEYNLFGTGLQGTGAPADYFDQLTPRKIDWIEHNIAHTRFYESNVAADGLVNWHPAGNLRFATKTSLQNNELYYLVQISFNEGRPGIYPGQTFGMCYFFKKLR